MKLVMKTLMNAAPVAVAVALVASLCLLPQARSADLPSSNMGQHPPAYPLKKSANGRYLVDSKGAPFLIAGDAPQALMVKLSEGDAELYFSNRVAHGFNAVRINLLCRPGTGGREDGVVGKNPIRVENAGFLRQFLEFFASCFFG